MLEKKVHGLWVAISFYSILSFLIFEFIVQGYSVVTSHVVNDVQWSYRPAILYYNPPIKIIHIKEWVIRKLQSGISGTPSLSNDTSRMLYASSLSYTRARRHLSSQIIIPCAGKSDTARLIWTIWAYHQTFPSSSLRALESLPLPSKTHPQSRGV